VIVVFDTTVLFMDVHASRSLTREVIRGAGQGDWRVVVPGVVVDEAVRQYPDRLRETVAGTRRAIAEQRRDLQALGLVVPEAPEVDLDALVAAYEPALRATLFSPGCEIADPPSAAEIVGEWAARRRAPFKEDGRGACDAFVWLTVLDQAEDDDVILVSANKHDFADSQDSTRLAPEFLADLEDRGIAVERVRRVDTVHQLLTALRTPEQQALERARAILADPGSRAALIARISLDASWSPSEWDSMTDWNLGVSVEDVSLQAFDADELELESAEEADDGSLMMLLRATGSGSFDFFVEKSEMASAPEGSPAEIYSSDWNDWYHWGQATLAATAEVDVRVRGVNEFETSIESLEPA
jgi:predicted nucleic acid-binding protein